LSEETRAEFRARIQSIQFGGKAPKYKPVVDKAAGTRTTVAQAEDEGGRIAGRHIEHKDGHVDAVVTPQTARLQFSAKEL
jgi:hypothetical protein